MQVFEPRAQRRGGRVGGESALPRDQDGAKDTDLESGPGALSVTAGTLGVLQEAL